MYEAFDRSRHAERFCYREPWNKGGSGDCGKRRLQNQRNPGRTDLCDAGHASGTYLQTKEGLHLPVAHCIEGTNGHCLCPAVEQALKEKQVDAARKIQKPTFGSMELIEKLRSDEKIVADSNLQIELVGLCTGICVLSNAILCKAAFPEADVIVDAAACACVTPASHDTALAAMKLCQIEVEKEGKEPWRN